MDRIIEGANLGRIRNFGIKGEIKERWRIVQARWTKRGGCIISTDRLTSIIVTFPAATRFFYYFAPQGPGPLGLFSGHGGTRFISE